MDDLIREVASKHGVALGRDDPILIVQTMLSTVSRETTAAQQAMLAAFRSDLEAANSRWTDDAQDVAERALQAALNASRQAMAEGIEAGTKAVAGAMRAEADRVARQLQAPLRDARRIALMNMTAAGMSLLAAAVAAWVFKG